MVVTDTNANGGTSLLKAQQAWGHVPDWIEKLAISCDETSQKRTADRIGYSASVVNQILKNTYAGNMAKVERAVRVVFLPEQIECPVLGHINTTRCDSERKKPASIANKLRIALSRSCPTCAHNKDE